MEIFLVSWFPRPRLYRRNVRDPLVASEFRVHHHGEVMQE